MLLAAIGVACAANSLPIDSRIPNDALRSELLEIEKQDQAGRDSIAIAIAANDTAYIFRMMRGDSARTRRLREIVTRNGWPRVADVGKQAANAAWLVLQHSPSLEFQSEMLPHLEKLSKAGEFPASEVAMLTDRVLVNQGKPQRYGSSFTLVNGRFVAHPIEKLDGLDELRASVGLMPMAEYVKGLAEIYSAPVEWPPRS